MSIRRISVVVTRFPNSSLESATLAALLAEGKDIPTALGFAQRVKFEYRSTARLKIALPQPTPEEFYRIRDEQRAEGRILFNVSDEFGTGHFDHHGDQANASLTSIDRLWVGNELIEQSYAYLVDPLLAISQNDAYGNALPGGSENLRKLMNLVVALRPNDWEFQQQWLTLAIRGVFANHHQTGIIGSAFTIDGIIDGVSMFAPEKVDEMTTMLNEGDTALAKDRQIAKDDVRQALDKNQLIRLTHPTLSPRLVYRGKDPQWHYGRNLRVIWVRSDSTNAAYACRDPRTANADIAVVFRSNGHVQVFQSYIVEHQLPPVGAKQPGQTVGKHRLKLGPVAKALRLAEANLTDPQRILLDSQDWQNDEAVYDTNGDIVQWYQLANQAMVMNGTLSSPDMPPTRIRHDKVVDVICSNLAKCEVSTQDPETDDWS